MSSFWFLVSLSGNLCHLPSVPGNSGRSSRKFFKRTEFLIRLRQGYSEGFREQAGEPSRRYCAFTQVRRLKTAKQAADDPDLGSHQTPPSPHLWRGMREMMSRFLRILTMSRSQRHPAIAGVPEKTDAASEVIARRVQMFDP
jgi:hypothetical protein